MVIVDKMGTAAPNEPLRFSPSLLLSVCLSPCLCLSLSPSSPTLWPQDVWSFHGSERGLFSGSGPAPSLLWGAGSTPARPPPIGDPSSSDLHPACCSLNFFFVPLLILICFAAWALFNGGWSFTNLLILSLDLHSFSAAEGAQATGVRCSGPGAKPSAQPSPGPADSRLRVVSRARGPLRLHSALLLRDDAGHGARTLWRWKNYP